MNRRIVMLLCGSVLTCACGRPQVTTTQSDWDEVGQRSDQYSVSTTFENAAKAKLNQARQLARDGQHRQAIALLETLRSDRDLDDVARQEVLLTLGEIHGSWTNAFKDYDEGLRYLRKLLQDYPETPHRTRAEELIGQYTAAPKN